MNLHSIATGVISVVNPPVIITLLKNIGFEEDETGDGTKIPKFTVSTGPAQIQGVSGRDLNFLANQNIQGIVRRVFLYGHWSGINKKNQTGGDILKFPEVLPDGPICDWKIVLVEDVYPGWVSVIVVMQSEVITP